jgi:hypothetical protein
VLRSHHLRGGLRCVVPNGTGGENKGNPQLAIQVAVGCGAAEL